MATNAKIPWSSNPQVRKKRSHLPFCAEDFKKGEISFPSPYIVPNLISLNPGLAKPEVIPATDLIRRFEMDNPICIIGNPFVGKTCLFLKLIAEANNCFGLKHWVRMMDLRTAVASYADKPRKPSSFVELLADQLHAPLSTVKDLFRPIKNAREIARRQRFEKLIKGELFLDGLDEIPEADRFYFLKLILPLKEKRYECPIRIWISCRTHYKDPLLRLMEADSTAWEIQDYDVDLQKNLLFYRWKEQNFGKLTSLEEARLWQYTQHIYADLCREIKDFDKTLGSAPFYLEIISSIYNEHVRQFMNIFMKAKKEVNPQTDHQELSNNKCQSCGPQVAKGNKKLTKRKVVDKGPPISEEKDIPLTTVQILDKLAGLPMMEFLEQLVYTAVDVYCLKYHFDRALSDPDFRSLVSREYQRAIAIYSRYATHTHENSYEFEIYKADSRKIGFRELNPAFKIEEDLHNMGFIVVASDKPDVLQLRNRLFGDFFLGRQIGMLANHRLRDLHYERFLVRNMLFEPCSQTARGFLDKTLGVDPVGFEYKGLHDFLVNHYFLRPTEEEDMYFRTCSQGSCFHLAIMDGFYQLAMAMIRCFDPQTEKELLRKFLRIQVPIEIYEGARSNGQVILVPGIATGGRHPVTSLGVVALFGCGPFVQEFLKLYATIFSASEIQDEFSRADCWTPYHYAAMHSNLWFFQAVFNREEGLPAQAQPQPGLYCRTGQLATHLLMTYCWNHVMVLREPTSIKPYHHDDGGCCCDDDDSCQDSGPACGDNNICRDVIGFRMMIKDFEHTKDGELLQLAHLECIRRLVNVAKEDVNGTEKTTGNTMLHYACLSGQPEAVKVLLELGAVVDIQNAEGREPLHYAALQGMRSIFLTLVRAGARPLSQDIHGYTPVSLWFSYGEKIDELRNAPMTDDEKKFFQTLTDLKVLLKEKMDKQSKLDMGIEAKREEIRDKLQSLQKVQSSESSSSNSSSEDDHE